MELARGIEPPTSGLQNRCSAIELRQHVGSSCVRSCVMPTLVIPAHSRPVLDTGRESRPCRYEFRKAGCCFRVIHSSW